MIRRILLALDPDKDTPVAMHYAFDIAHRYGAHVTGMAYVDTKRIEESASGGGIGSMFYADKMREKLVATTREKAQELLDSFAEASEKEKVTYTEEVKEGAPSERIIEEMRYHEMLIMGNDPHYFYGHPDEHTTTLAHVVKGCVAPVLIVTDKYKPIKTVLLAYDGSAPAARAMQRFAMIRPFGRDLNVHVVGIYEDGDSSKAELDVKAAAEYLQFYGHTTQEVTLQGYKPVEHILSYSDKIEADLIIAGAHSTSMMHKLVFGSTTETLVTQAKVPLFLER